MRVGSPHHHHGEHNHSLTHHHNAARRDPTRTSGVRARFEKEVNRRFNEFRAIVNKAIKELDVLAIKTNALPSRRAFDFARSGDKVSAFMEWLKKQEDETLLGIRPGTPIVSAAQSAWTNLYIESAYQTGLANAGKELRRAGATVKDEWLREAFFRPIHADRVGLIYTRVFEDLTGITNVMDTQISRVLAMGMAEGRSPEKIARDLSSRIDSIGLTRARTLARTEVISAHAEASLNAYTEAGLEGVNVQAEWSTTGDDKVCPECEDMQGRTFTLEEARGMIPAHPNCRCAFIPSVGDPIAPANEPTSTVVDLANVMTNPDPDAEDLIGSGFEPRERNDIRASHDDLEDYVNERELPSDQRAAVDYYAGKGYHDINVPLREGRELTDEARKNLDIVEGLLQPTSQDYTLYRGVESPPNLNVGDTFTSAGLTSTSRSSAVGVRFGSNGGTVYQISLPEKSRALVYNRDEAEVLLPHNTRFRVLEVIEVPEEKLTSMRRANRVVKLEVY